MEQSPGKTPVFVPAVSKPSSILSIPMLWLLNTSFCDPENFPYCLTMSESLATESPLIPGKSLPNTLSLKHNLQVLHPVDCSLLGYFCRMTPGQKQLPGKHHKPQCWSWWMLMCHWTPMYQINVFLATAKKSPQKSHLWHTGASAGRLLRPWGQDLICITICNAQFPLYSVRLNWIRFGISKLFTVDSSLHPVLHIISTFPQTESHFHF